MNIMKIKGWISIIIMGLLISGCGKKEDCSITLQANLDNLAQGEKQIVMDVSLPQWRTMETLNTLEEPNEMGYDFRHKDVRALQVNKKEIIQNIIYDTSTVWPSETDADFQPEEWLESGKNPGLGIRSLQEQGITGEGVNIAIIDQNLLLNHEEYKDQIQLYETNHTYGKEASFHGSAVASIAVGKNVGVAPDADLYFIASEFSERTCDNEGTPIENLNYMAEGIERILEINKKLPKNDKIRVISISKGFSDLEKDDQKHVYDAIEKAKKENVLVITTSMEMNYKYGVLGLDCQMRGDRDDVQNYTLGSWLDAGSGRKFTNSLFIPMGNRTVASFASLDGYEYMSVGGLSWTCPWLAGMYALCIQVNPEITPEEFLDLAYQTGVESIEKIGSFKSNILQNIMQLTALIEKVKEMK